MNHIIDSLLFKYDNSLHFTPETNDIICNILDIFTNKTENEIIDILPEHKNPKSYKNSLKCYAIKRREENKSVIIYIILEIIIAVKLCHITKKQITPYILWHSIKHDSELSLVFKPPSIPFASSFKKLYKIKIVTKLPIIISSDLSLILKNTVNYFLNLSDSDKFKKFNTLNNNEITQTIISSVLYEFINRNIASNYTFSDIEQVYNSLFDLTFVN